MDHQTRILILEDVATDAELIQRELQKANISFTSQRVETRDDFSKALVEFDPDIILSDYGLPQFSGLEALRLLKEKESCVPFVLITGSLSEEVAVDCMKQGATDYILKSNLTRLPAAVESALKRSETEKERAAALEALHESQEQLRQAQKLEVVGRLAGGIAHDFNNLLTVIGGYTDLLLSASTLDDDAREKMKEVNEAAQRAESLVRQLLAFSRKQVLQPEVLDPNKLVDGISKMLQRLIGEDIEIVNRLCREVWKINADRGQFEQVLINLAVNARDAMPQGGKITIVTENVDLDQTCAGLHIAVKPGAYVMLAVSDTGTGMDAETQQHIFEPFFTTKEVGKGTGLGLATIYGIVKQSGGSIWVYSETGKGTTFKIYLPRVDAEASTSAQVRAHPTTAANETILLVEDEEMVRKLACDILSARGYRVLAAKNGDDAIAICGNHSGRIDLLLTDVVMPGTGGTDVADSIKRRRQEMHVLYMSGYTDDAIVHHGVLDPGTSFIEKPFTADKLVTKVQEALGKSPNNGKEASNGA